MRNAWIWTATSLALAPTVAAGDDAGPRPTRPPELAALRASTVSASPSPQAVTPPPSFSLKLGGDMELEGDLFQDGRPFLHADGGVTYGNTACGLDALANSTPGVPYAISGAHNSALGASALQFNTEGHRNTAAGFSALLYNTTGWSNTAIGSRAMLHNSIGFRNTAVGAWALYSNVSGPSNTAVGDRALLNNLTGDDNVAVGSQAMFYATDGSKHTAVGPLAGFLWTNGFGNIAVGHGAFGAAGETHTIRIGGASMQDRTFIEGISATLVSGTQVRITADDQLGIAVSSARFKQDIHDLEGVSQRLTDLRPVSFRYKEEVVGQDANPIEYGLVAEEVAEVFPELVVNDNEGRPFTVRYDLLTPLLLHELQRQSDVIATLLRRVDKLEQDRSLVSD